MENKIFTARKAAEKCGKNAAFKGFGIACQGRFRVLNPRATNDNRFLENERREPVSSAPQVSSIISKRYAAAFLDLAAKANKIDTVENDLRDLQAMIDSSPDLQTLVRSPLNSGARQGSAIAAIADKAKLDALTKNLLGVLVQNRRLNALEAIIKSAKRDIIRRRGETTAKVQTATILSDSQTKALQKAISQALGSNVALDVQVDPSILGGMIVTVGSRMIDDSVRRKLERLRSAMGANTNSLSQAS